VSIEDREDRLRRDRNARRRTDLTDEPRAEHPQPVTVVATAKALYVHRGTRPTTSVVDARDQAVR
jgi:hypothetical protein